MPGFSIIIMLPSVFSVTENIEINRRDMSRNSRSLTFFKNGVYKNFANFTGKYLCWSLFLKKRLYKGVFLWSLRNFKNTLFKEHLQWLLPKMQFCIFLMRFKKTRKCIEELTKQNLTAFYVTFKCVMPSTYVQQNYVITICSELIITFYRIFFLLASIFLEPIDYTRILLKKMNGDIISKILT